MPLQVQALLGAKHAVAFDITAACSGFVVAMNTAAQFIRTGTYKNIVVIGADCLSRYVDWRDRCEPPLPSPCVLDLPVHGNCTFGMRWGLKNNQIDLVHTRGSRQQTGV